MASERVASWPQSSRVEAFTHWVGLGRKPLKGPVSCEEGRGLALFSNYCGVTIVSAGGGFVSFSGVLPGLLS